MTNMVEVGGIASTIQLSRLLEKKLIVDEIQVVNVSLDTPRQTSGELIKEKKAPKEPSKLKKAASDMVQKKLRIRSQK